MAKKKEEGRRQKGTGYLLQRNGWFYFIYKGKKRSLKTKDKTEAEEKIQEILPSDLLKTKEDYLYHIGQTKKLLSKEKSPVLKDIFQEFSDAPNRKPCAIHTLKVKEARWNHFKNFLPQNVEVLSDITFSHVNNYFKILKKEKQPRTYNGYIKDLKHIFNVLGRKNDNPFDEISFMEEDIVKKREFSFETVEHIFWAFDDRLYKKLPFINSEKIFNKATGQYCFPKVKPKLHLMHKEEARIMFHLGAWTGQRLKDCALFEWKNVDLKENIIYVLPYKTRKKKKELFPVPIHPNLRPELELAWKNKINEYVLPSIARRYKYNHWGIDKDAVKVLRYIGLDVAIDNGPDRRASNVYGFHSFRHTFAYFLLEQNWPYEIIEALIGSGAKVIKKHYTKHGIDKLKKVINSVPKLQKQLDLNDVSNNSTDEVQHTKSKIIEELNQINNLEELKQVYTVLNKKRD